MDGILKTPEAVAFDEKMQFDMTSEYCSVRSNAGAGVVGLSTLAVKSAESGCFLKV